MEPELKKSNKKTIIIIVAIVAAIAIAVGVGVIVYSDNPSKRLQVQLDLGARYLSELDYEQAIAAYEAAIEIDPKSAEAYRGLITAFGEQGDYEAVADSYARAAVGMDATEMTVLSSALDRMISDHVDALISEGRTEEALRVLEMIKEVSDSPAIREKEQQVKDVEEEPGTPPLPEEYRTIVKAILDLRYLDYYGIPIREWTRADMDAFITSNNLEEDNTFVSLGLATGYRYIPAGMPYPDGHFFPCVDKGTYMWWLSHMHHAVTADKWKQNTVAYLAIPSEDVYKEFGFFSGKLGVDRFGVLAPFEQFFEENNGTRFYQELQGGNGSYRVDERCEIKWRLEGEFIAIEMYDEDGECWLKMHTSSEGYQTWTIMCIRETGTD